MRACSTTVVCGTSWPLRRNFSQREDVHAFLPQFLLGIALLSGIAAGPLQAQDYLSRPLYIVTTSPPGGGDDFLVRFLAQKMSTLANQTVVVENKPGAGTVPEFPVNPGGSVPQR
jgi:hypothetical protein